MDESSSGFGDESPILFKYQKLSYEFSSKNEHFTVDGLYKELILYMKKSRNFTREELKSFSEQVNKVSPEDPKTRWLLKKIRGLLSFILKKRADFQKSVVKGKVVIYEKSNSEQYSPGTMVINASNSVCTNSTINIPSNMLTNNNFVSVVSKKENEKSYNYSEDLFNSDTVENLYNFSQENYQLFKSLTQNSVSIDVPKSDDQIFKVPTECGNVYQILEKMQDNFKLSTCTAETVSGLENYEDNLKNTCEAAMEDNTEYETVNIFDQLTENTEDLQNEFIKKHEETKQWVSEIIANFMKLDVKKKYKIKNNENSPLNERTVSPTGLQTFYSEENFRIVRETCQKFKANLKLKKNFEILQNYDFLQ